MLRRRRPGEQGADLTHQPSNPIIPNKSRTSSQGGSLAGQVAHSADTVEWFMAGAFGDGWDLDFDASVAKAKAVTSLSEATEWFDRAFADAIATIHAQSDEQLQAPIEDTRIMGAAPRLSVVSGIVDHTAHHRGSLAVYARLLGKVPLMPYS